MLVWLQKLEAGIYPTEQATFGDFGLAVFEAGGEWHWVVQRDRRDEAKGSAPGRDTAKRLAEERAHELAATKAAESRPPQHARPMPRKPSIPRKPEPAPQPKPVRRPPQAIGEPVWPDLWPDLANIANLEPDPAPETPPGRKPQRNQ